MTSDALVYCPGGTGKKIKHCACRDISSDLEKIVRALQGNQRVAALDRINRILATKANRPCLLALKIMTLMDMNNLQSLEETVTTFVAVAPENTLAHTFAAILEVRKGHCKEAVDSLQKALSLTQETFPGELYDAIGLVAQTLAQNHKYLAARGHMLFRAMIGNHDEEAIKPLIAISSAAGVPTLLKRDLIFSAIPEKDVPWKQQFVAISAKCANGMWKQGLEELEQLHEQYPGEELILRDIAIARSYLGHSSCAQAWHDYAAVEAVDFEDAVNAEATALLLDYENTRKTVGVVKLTFDVIDASALQEKLLSSKQISAEPIDRASLGESDSPPPRAIFQLLDRPMPAGDAEVTLDIVPRVLCQMLLYGRETDREARLVVIVAKGTQFDSTRAALAQMTGELIVEDSLREEILDTIPADIVELFPRIKLPQQTFLTQQQHLSDEATAAAFLEKWATLPLVALDDKTPQEVAGDPTYERRLAATLLALEQMAEVESWPVDVDALRKQLGVPVPETITPAQFELASLEPQQWRRVDPEQLTDEQLLNFYQQVSIYSARKAIQRAGREILRRGIAGEQISLASVAGGLAQLSNDPDEALEFVLQARKLAEKAGDSPAQWYLAELPQRLIRGETAQVQHILTVLQTRHIREPGVSQSLYNILVRFGIITPEGHIPQELSDGAAQSPEPASPEQKIWTSESGPSPTEGEQKESKLWVPGMD